MPQVVPLQLEGEGMRRLMLDFEGESVSENSVSKMIRNMPVLREINLNLSNN